MTLNEYQTATESTVAYPPGLTYPTIGLLGEAGELANQVKKVIRDDGGVLTPARRAKIVDELGDVLWYIAAVAREMKTPLSFVADANLRKLAKRKKQGTLQGDNRDAQG